MKYEYNDTNTIRLMVPPCGLKCKIEIDGLFVDASVHSKIENSFGWYVFLLNDGSFACSDNYFTEEKAILVHLCEKHNIDVLETFPKCGWYKKNKE